MEKQQFKELLSEKLRLSEKSNYPRIIVNCAIQLGKDGKPLNKANAYQWLQIETRPPVYHSAIRRFFKSLPNFNEVIIPDKRIAYETDKYFPNTNNNSKETYHKILVAYFDYCQKNKLERKETNSADLFLQTLKDKSEFTYNTYLSCLRTYFKYYGIWYQKPCITIKESKTRKIVLSKKQVKLFFDTLNSMKNVRQDAKNAIWLLYFKGLRSAELITLKHISDNKHLLTVAKNGSQKIIKLPFVYNPCFAETSNIRKLVKKVARQAFDAQTANRVSPHCFRHSKAVHLKRAGHSLQAIRHFLNHKKFDSSAFYAQID